MIRLSMFHRSTPYQHESKILQDFGVVYILKRFVREKKKTEIWYFAAIIVVHRGEEAQSGGV